MYKDYTLSLLQEYERKKASNDLTSRLASPTPASLREECFDGFKRGVQRKDMSVLRVFFGLNGDETTYLDTIENFKLSKFKPLIKYLKRDIKETGKKNIELLAWLIDYNPRPFNSDVKYPEAQLSKTNKSQQASEQLKTEDADEGGKEKQRNETAINGESKEDKRSSVVWYRRYFVITMIALILMIGLTGYKLLQSTESNQVPTEPNKLSTESNQFSAKTGLCMHWNLDHYERIPCNYNDGGNAIPFDSAKFSNFRKIVDLSTIDLTSIGKVWYLKKFNRVEFFTDRGQHPIYGTDLKPVTEHIITKYVLENIYLVNNGTVIVK